MVRLTGQDLLSNKRLVGIYGHVLHGDLLLPPASMMIESFGQICHRSCGLVGKRKIFQPCLEML